MTTLQPEIFSAENKTTARTFWPLLLIFIRFPLIMLGNAIGYAYFASVGDATPWETALMWGNFHTPLIADSITIALVIWLLRREGLTVRSMMATERRGRDVLIGLSLFFVLYIALIVGSMLGGLAAYGMDVFNVQELPALTRADMPPLWYYIWSIVVLSATVAIAEEFAYRGYAQPRLEARWGKWVALVVVAFGFGVQHIAFSVTDWQAALARFIGTFFVGLIFGAIYMKQRRLLPLIIAHWLVDVVGLGLFPLMYYLSLA